MNKSLYCVKFLNHADQIIDVQHITATTYKDVHNALDRHMEQLHKYNILEYASYRFFRVQEVDKLIDEIVSSTKDTNNSGAIEGMFLEGYKPKA